MRKGNRIANVPRTRFKTAFARAYTQLGLPPFKSCTCQPFPNDPRTLVQVFSFPGPFISYLNESTVCACPFWPPPLNDQLLFLSLTVILQLQPPATAHRTRISSIRVLKPEPETKFIADFDAVSQGYYSDGDGKWSKFHVYGKEVR